MADPVPPTYQQDTWGVMFTIPVANLASDTAKLRLLVVKPDGMTLIDRLWPAPTGQATTVYDAPNKTFSWLVTSGDLDQTGRYRYQLVDVTTGRQVPTGTGVFAVAANLTDLPPVTP